MEHNIDQRLVAQNCDQRPVAQNCVVELYVFLFRRSTSIDESLCLIWFQKFLFGIEIQFCASARWLRRINGRDTYSSYYDLLLIVTNI